MSMPEWKRGAVLGRRTTRRSRYEEDSSIVLTERTEPELVTAAREMVSGGVPWRDVAAALEVRAGGARDVLAEATLYWVREMGRRRSDDFQASAVLRALEAALARTPRNEVR